MLDLAVKTVKRLLTLRMIAWSPVLVAAVLAWWGVQFWRDRRRSAASPS